MANNVGFLFRTLKFIKEDKMKREEIVNIMLDIPIFGKKRNPKSELDFGDEETVFLNTKRISEKEPQFGKYLGQLNNRKWAIGIKDFATWSIIDIEMYDTLEELKQNWILD
jgi:hypothetical protein